ncbi:MAG TPA: FHA domain-containing protein [Ktedonobacteraceae bacterium]|nr:FHA domain-containing protein [Ktedonobacteraceae bacterium]
MEASLNGPSGNIALSAAALTIGRAPDNLLVLPDPQSSSHHAEVRPDVNGYVVIDLNSTNGTFVNEQRLAPQAPRPLITGDVIRIGAARFTYEVAGSFGETLRAGASEFNSNAYQPTVSASPPPASVPQYQSYPDYPAYQAPQAQPPSGYGDYGQQQGFSGYQQPPVQPGTPPVSAPQGYPIPQAGFQQQWNALPGQMGAPQIPQVASAPAKKKSRTGLVIGLVVLLLLLVGGGIGGYLYLRSTPDKTLQAYCNGWLSSNAQEVFDQLSTQAQTQTSVSKISAIMQSANDPRVGGFKTCTFTPPQQSSTTATSTVTLTLTAAIAPPIVTHDVLIDENGTWKISQ